MPSTPTRAAATLALATLSALLTPATVQAQAARPLVVLGNAIDDSLRAAPLRDSTVASGGWLLRSPSSLDGYAAPRDSTKAFSWSLVTPDVTAIFNGGTPYSMNDGALWAGTGANLRALAGVRMSWGSVRLIVAPELLLSANGDFALTDTLIAPPFPAGFSKYANPWYTSRNSIDLPLRFGDAALTRLVPGQSSLVVAAGPVEVGAATENEWWGPGVRNALLLSSNAGGFPHLFARTGAPVETRIGAFEARWLTGALAESDYFDSDVSNDTRSIALLGVTWQPRWERGLTVGAARAVFAPATSAGDAFADAFRIFADVGTPNARAHSDTTRAPGRDQLLSLFAQWVTPGRGFEVYTEWARAEMPRNLRDLLVQPMHSQAYTVGLQWLSSQGARGGRVRVRGEASYLEQSSTYRSRPMGTWYTSRAVAQGYTHEGQSLGAAIGPGSSSQWTAVDYVRDAWRLGVSLERVRWLEDAHSLATWPQGGGWCEHDVSMRPGISGAVRTRFGTLSGEATAGTRYNAFFNHYGQCPFGTQRFDVGVRTLSIGFRTP